MSEKRLVAVCDILGFTNLILNHDLDALITGKLSLFRKLLGFSVMHGAVPDFPAGLKELREQNRVGLAWFSDTIIIYAKKDDDLSCRNVLETVGWLLFHTMWSQTRIRAGIAYNEFFAEPENEIFLGKAIVEAYKLEQDQEWSGAALTLEAANRIPKPATTGERFQWWICSYEIPMKPPKDPMKTTEPIQCSNVAIDWTQGTHDQNDFSWSEKEPEPSEEKRFCAGNSYDKWKNTRNFHREICISCFPKNKGRDPLKSI